MLVEPESLCWLTGRMVDGPRRRHVGAGIRPIPGVELPWSGTTARAWAKGWKLERARRRAAHRGDIDDGLDVFHTFREGGRALRTTWGAATRAWNVPPRAQQALDRRGHQGQSRTGHATQTNRLWRRAESLWDQAAAAETAWKQAKSAFEFFTPEGRLNDRRQAEAVVAGGAASPDRPGVGQDAADCWDAPESFTFLDQTHRQLAGSGHGPRGLVRVVGPGRVASPALATVGNDAWNRPRHGAGPWPARSSWRRRDPDWCAQAGRVHQVLRGVWRASSLVECVNSVARMQQARHRKMTQGLLDLKRLYWNLRRFRTGRRKNQTPYDLLGLKLPDLSSLGVPQADPGGIAETTVRNGGCADRVRAVLDRPVAPDPLEQPARPRLRPGDAGDEGADLVGGLTVPRHHALDLPHLATPGQSR